MLTKCKAPVKSSPPTNQHPASYWSDALPVTQITVSEHWRDPWSLYIPTWNILYGIISKLISSCQAQKHLIKYYYLRFCVIGLFFSGDDSRLGRFYQRRTWCEVLQAGCLNTNKQIHLSNSFKCPVIQPTASKYWRSKFHDIGKENFVEICSRHSVYPLQLLTDRQTDPSASPRRLR